MRILTKAAMTEMMRWGAFGNTARSWPSIAAYEDAGRPCNVGIRYADPKGGGGPFVSNLEPNAVATNMLLLVGQGWREEFMYLQEATPDDRLLLNGEVVERPDVGYSLHYSTAKTHMRAALKKSPLWAHGPRAILILKQVMNESSYGDLRALMDRFPDAAIELSVFDKCLGTVSGRNALVWEVRHY